MSIYTEQGPHPELLRRSRTWLPYNYLPFEWRHSLGYAGQRSQGFAEGLDLCKLERAAGLLTPPLTAPILVQTLIKVPASIAPKSV